MQSEYFAMKNPYHLRTTRPWGPSIQLLSVLQFAITSSPYGCHWGRKLAFHVSSQCPKGHVISTPSLVKRFYTQNSCPVYNPPSSGFLRLSGRSLVAVTGSEAARFLQGLATSNIPINPTGLRDTGPETISRATFTAFLNAQGRILQDAFIYPLECIALSTQSKLGGRFRQTYPFRNGDEGFLIEIDSSQAMLLLKSLRRFKLRSKVSVELIDPRLLSVYFLWVDQWPASDLWRLLNRIAHCVGHISLDDRAPNFGYRLLIPEEALAEYESVIDVLPPPIQPIRASTMRDYTIRRYLHSIPEGQTELPREHSLVQESGIDFMRGVDFRKGCYVGQELTIRTQHTGVVRKRILPVMIYHAGTMPPDELAGDANINLDVPVLPYGTNIKCISGKESAGKKDRSAGRLVGNVGGIGLALVRLETMVGLGPTGEELEGWSGHEFRPDLEGGGCKDLRVKAFVPKWWDTKRFIN